MADKKETLQQVRQRLAKQGTTRCTQCGYRVRGANHENGRHHKK